MVKGGGHFEPYYVISQPVFCVLYCIYSFLPHIKSYRLFYFDACEKLPTLHDTLKRINYGVFYIVKIEDIESYIAVAKWN